MLVGRWDGIEAVETETVHDVSAQRIENYDMEIQLSKRFCVDCSYTICRMNIVRISTSLILRGLIQRIVR